MENLLREIIKRLLAIESKLDALNPPKKELKIINRTELCKRLGITEPTVRAGEKKGYIPSFSVNSTQIDPLSPFQIDPLKSISKRP